MSAHLLSTVDETAPSRCHHCGAPLGRRSREITVSGREVQVCGDACRTAVETIANAGLDAWYGLRTHPDAQGAATADPRHQAEIDAWRVPEVEAALLRRTGEGDGRAGVGHEMNAHGKGTCGTGAHGTSTHGKGTRGTDAHRTGTLGTSTRGTNAHGTGTHGTGTLGTDTRGTGTLGTCAHRTCAVTLTVEGMRCAGCAWLVERLLASIPGVSAAAVDFPLRRAEVHFDARATRLHVLLETLAKAGYRTVPYNAHEEEAAIESERRIRIRGLGISALFGMQVMLLSIALYASDHQGGMDAGFEQLFRWLAMMLTVPVLAWPGRTFFTGALAALRGRRLTMDVPVALGLSIAFVASAFATITGEGAIWFDSVVMFVTLLGGARYLELLARRRATAAIRALARSAPLVATRVREDRNDGATEGGVAPGNGLDSGEGGAGIDRVPAAALRSGDRVRIRPGEVVPADGVILSGHSAFDESLLTGESSPVPRSAGEKVLAGSVNGLGVVEVRVDCAGDETVLGGVLRRAEQAARERPAIALLADRAAAWFIAGVLVLAAGVAIGWLVHDPSRMVPVLISVLVVTCPCALSLATPAAMTAALGALARAGLIVTRANAVERLALATHCLADKTGTLTEGRFRLRSVSALAGVPEPQCLALAAALERYAAHPVASAIVAAAGCANSVVEDAGAHTGGVEGRIGGVRYAVGSADFVARACALVPGKSGLDGGDRGSGAGGDRGGGNDDGATRVFLAREGVLLARFTLADTLHTGATALVQGLRARGVETTIASGDSPGAVERTARALGVTRHLAGLSPEDKLDEAARLAARGEQVLMLGDGVNDTPALAGAHVSVAMGRGAAAAAARADAVLIGDDPEGLLAGLDVARRARRIVKQNLAWALGYNLIALPLAAAGAVPPWAAAVGMSLSSLAVIGNALRLGRAPDASRR